MGATRPVTTLREHPNYVARLAVVAIVALATSAGCVSGKKAGPPTLPSGFDQVDVTVQYMTGPAETTITNSDDITALRDSVNRLPMPGKHVEVVTDQGSWTLVFTGQGQPTTMTFDEGGDKKVRVRATDGTTAIRQGNEQLRDQLTHLMD